MVTEGIHVTCQESIFDYLRQAREVSETLSPVTSQNDKGPFCSALEEYLFTLYGLLVTSGSRKCLKNHPKLRQRWSVYSLQVKVDLILGIIERVINCQMHCWVGKRNMNVREEEGVRSQWLGIIFFYFFKRAKIRFFVNSLVISRKRTVLVIHYFSKLKRIELKE